MLKLNDTTSCKGLFFIMAFYVGLWTVRIPTIKDQLLTDYLGIGLIFTTFSIGSIIAMFYSTLFIKKYSTKIIIFYSMVIQALLWTMVPFVPNLQIFMILSFVFGCCYGAFEVSVNFQASNIEIREKKSMMSGFHGFFSLGVLLGSILTSILLQWNLSFFINAISYVLILLPLSIFFTINLAEDKLAIKSEKSSIFFVWPTLLFILVALSISVALVEGGVDSWGALYMRDIILEDGFKIGIASISFNIFMVLGRFTGDYLRDKLGIYFLLNTLLLLMIIGLSILINLNTFYFSMLGFSVLGFGASSIVPIAYSLAGKIEDIEATISITIISMAVYGIFMVAPAILGIMANLYGIVSVFIPMLIACFFCIFPVNILKNQFKL